MAVEDFTTYTEVDPGTKITVIASRVTWADLQISEAAYVYYDKGANFFAGNFTMYLTVKMTAGTQDGEAYCWALTNTVDTMRAIDLASGSYLTVYLYQGSTQQSLILEECDGGSLALASWTSVVLNTPYYLKIVRDESAGTYGTLYCYVYSDSARTTLLTTITRTLHTSKKDFRYIFGLNSLGAGTTQKTSGYVENLTIDSWGGDFSAESPSVTIQATTAIAATTATGNGNVTSLGNPPATQYGHCWATHPNPTTANDVTQGGAPSATGAFTSSLTGLEQNKTYYMRAYIVNALGTFYSSKLAMFTTSADVPVVTTDPVTGIAATTAQGNGSIDNNGGSAVTQHGVCWSTSANPTIADSKTEEGATDVIGDFFSLMTELSASTTYHVRAYATNDAGTGYGVDIEFTTFAVGAPIVTTEEATNISGTSAQGNGTIVSEGGSAVTEHGHCWDTSHSPKTADSGSGRWGKTTEGAGSVGIFTSVITGLGAATKYYIRAYAKNTQGTAYGDNVTIREIAGELSGNIAVKKEYVVYTSKSGKQRALLGAEF